MPRRSNQVGESGAAHAGAGPTWAERAAGTASAESVKAIVDTPVTELSRSELVDAIVAAEKAMSLVAASQLRLLTEFARPGRAGDVSGLVEALLDKGGLGHRPDGTLDLEVVQTIVTDRAAFLAATEVAAALRISPITAGLRVRKAKELCEQLPDTVAALAAGRIDRGRALLMAERTAVLSPELRLAVQDRVLPLAETRSAGNLRGLLDRAVIAADPAAAEEREQKAQRERELTLLPLPDGMASVKAFAPAAGAVSIFAVADLLAGRTGGVDDRPVGARRVDAWVDIAEQLLTYGRVDLSGLLDDPDDPTTDDLDGVDRSDTDKAGVIPQDVAHQQHPVGQRDISSSAADRRGDVRVSEPDTAGGGGDVACGADGLEDMDVTVLAATEPFGCATEGTAPAAAGSGPDATADDDEANTPAAENAGPSSGPPCSCGGSMDKSDAGTSIAARTSSGSAGRPSTSRWASRRSRLPHLVVTMSASTWAGLDRLPAHLDGYGAVTAETGLALARSAKSITAALLDPVSGAVLGVGDREYRPRQAVRDAVTTATETCRFPSCRQPAWRCDLDHRERFDHHHPGDGGCTSQTNLDPLCRAHHMLKHRTNWCSIARDGYGRGWISPTGHHYFDPPRSLTLPNEQLTPTPAVGRPQSSTATIDLDDALDARNPERPDWREAEFGGAFPDTPQLRVLNTIARQRLQSIRDVRGDRRQRGGEATEAAMIGARRDWPSAGAPARGSVSPRLGRFDGGDESETKRSKTEVDSDRPPF